jgi:hypothetical protein
VTPGEIAAVAADAAIVLPHATIARAAAPGVDARLSDAVEAAADRVADLDAGLLQAKEIEWHRVEVGRRVVELRKERHVPAPIEMHHGKPVKRLAEEDFEPSLEARRVGIEEIEVLAVIELGVRPRGILGADRDGIPATSAQRRREVVEVVIGIVDECDAALPAARP